ncbi:MAG: hypothetical protein GFH27_549287n192 [Chloroflexi bacterium AL-W]|nr:hypothetical protein [Chloroflexi bacterium AL-N1]NOK66466.1 hypothetical protein [Chloroflexi bacterium AL-N10]NOK71854.1 hypothetical protein [Chloroflexi bacterium AL-N5]NOK81111.1 hypothetical protein [Chloroflexi bacterium AL-W]NOK89384.1 hypothetical protein [Chloroflexi bacterium AL-N15]
MNWCEVRAAIRQKYVDTYDASEADHYDTTPGHGLSTIEVESYWSDLQRVITLQPGSVVLDVGAGTGELCHVLLRVPGIKLSALEPSPAMLAKLPAKLPAVTPRSGFTDAAEDRRHFGPSEFDAIVSRQVVCSLFDPLQAFKNWHYWLKPHGLVVVIDGLFSREGWAGQGQAYVDVLPLASSQSLALTPYLLESVGFRVQAVEWMAATNATLNESGSRRYIVVASKQAEPSEVF